MARLAASTNSMHDASASIHSDHPGQITFLQFSLSAGSPLNTHTRLGSVATTRPDLVEVVRASHVTAIPGKIFPEYRIRLDLFPDGNLAQDARSENKGVVPEWPFENNELSECPEAVVKYGREVWEGVHAATMESRSTRAITSQQYARTCTPENDVKEHTTSAVWSDKKTEEKRGRRKGRSRLVMTRKL
ncbi:hypothetical protein BOTBODRAFT_47841 [Botryobasidium botryosum FD-172 SS1]|uniref:Uncharacterized protein n=1 Tax=Botryobasidium botryosum (strain FD-172 SS1) TaxID=930990 RepID=A0A067MAV0_BOTB1|nr:hypothetical protein BOTBODRAFT_47841 [Botryobasidium botryosum FD-172 SS1]